ncbi:MAG: aminoacyl-tRNA hydrolase, partial [Planctomycetes bacterium]|nr:aminoacyl-tRNA hydrolase [Planctomycetota bacterium]
MHKLVVGLGNPGPEYEWTPHNVGFHVLDALAARGKSIFRTAASLPGHEGPANFLWAPAPPNPGGDALLVKPLTFMNLSGKAVAPLVRRFGVPIENVFVVYDELDLPLGALRIRPHGGTAGHRGMQSILTELGSDRFPRLRVGIGRPRTDAARHVLTRLDENARVEAEIAAANAADALLDWLARGDLAGTMTRFHSRWNQ